MPSKIQRITQQIFASNPGNNQIGKFGSLAAGSPAYATTPAQAMSLSQWLTGWFGAVIGGSSPAIEDLNAYCFASTSQMAYLFQAGIPEYDAGTPYYTGSFAQVAGVVYVSLTDGNTGNAVTDPNNWILFSTEPTGTGKDYWGATLPAGYIWASGKTIGNASSNATERASVDTFNLYSLLWTNYSDAVLPMFTSGGLTSARGTSAASDFAAGKQMTVIDKRGRVSVAADALGGTAANRIGNQIAKTLGASGGEEAHKLLVTEMPSHTHTQNAHSHECASGSTDGNHNVFYPFGAGTDNVNSSNAGYDTRLAPLSQVTTAVNQNTGGDGLHNNMQPSIVCNYIIKL